MYRKQESSLFYFTLPFVVHSVKVQKQEKVGADDPHSGICSSDGSNTRLGMVVQADRAIPAHTQIHDELHNLEQCEVALPPHMKVERG